MEEHYEEVLEDWDLRTLLHSGGFLNATDVGIILHSSEVVITESNQTAANLMGLPDWPIAGGVAVAYRR